MGYGYGGHIGGFGMAFFLLYLVVVGYALYLLAQIAGSLRRIAASLERSQPGGQPQNDSP